MIGSFNYNAQKHENWSSLLITETSCEAMQQYIENDAHFIDVLTIDKKDYYHVFKKYDTHNLESKANIYHQIVQQENIELHKLSKIIEAKGGRVLDLMTDAITCTFPNNELPFDIEEDGIITGHKYKDGKSKYKLEEGHRVKIQRMKKHKLNTQKPRVQRLKYKIFNDVKETAHRLPARFNCLQVSFNTSGTYTFWTRRQFLVSLHGPICRVASDASTDDVTRTCSKICNLR
jgi:hypothetical protein